MTWPEIRALLIALVLIPNVIYALPIRQVPADALDTPLRRRELAEWSDTLARVGIDLPPDALGARVVDVSARAAAAHRVLKSPFQPVARLTGTNQAWALFAAATTHPTRLTVEAIGTSGRQVWFRRLDPDHAWLASRFRYRRLRGIYDLVPGRDTTAIYRRFAEGVGEWAFEARDDVHEVHVFLVDTPLVYPWEPPAPPGEALHHRVLRREGR